MEYMRKQEERPERVLRVPKEPPSLAFGYRKLSKYAIDKHLILERKVPDHRPCQ